jgi:hypothetical protein
MIRVRHPRAVSRAVPTAWVGFSGSHTLGRVTSALPVMLHECHVGRRILAGCGYQVTGIKHLLAKAARFDGAYLRFTGQVQLEHFVDGQSVEKVADPGIWELMWFGHVR